MADTQARPHTRTRSRSTPRSEIKGRKGRFDIQGLRAFAVVVVILDHMWQWPHGGFVGVDIFFVISGFLITGLLVREHERTGHISFGNFYRRRIRRIIPAAVMVLAVGLVWSYFVFAEARWRATVTDAIWALCFGANWRFQSLATDYFNADGPQSPFQHYWSLSIEEQFYFVWPWLMLLIFAVLLRRSVSFAQARVVVFATIATITVASFVYAFWLTGSNPTSAYFSTLTRVWELGLGATLAVASPFAEKIPDRIRPLLAWLGLAGMVTSIFLISDTMRFPAPWAALPVFSTALVIAAGTFKEPRRQQRFLWPLTNPISGYIGDISYSLYLWHFPIIIIGGAAWGDSVSAQVGIIAAVLVSSVYSYHLLENKIHHSSWLEPRKRKRKRSSSTRRSRWRIHVERRTQIAWLSLIGLVTVVLVAFAASPVDTPKGIDVSAPAPSTGEGEDAAGPKLTALQGEIADALGSTTWPELAPSFDEALASRQAPDDVMDCGLEPVVVADCTWGDPKAKHTAMIVGDSIGMSYVEAFRTALGDGDGWDVVSYAGFGCPFVAVTTENSDADLMAACPDRNKAAVKAVNEIQPDLLLVINGYGPRTEAGASQPMTSDEWAQANTDLIDQFSDSYGKLLFVASPPWGVDPSECYTRQSSPADCANTVNDDWTARATTEQAIATDTARAQWVDSTGWFCVEGYCPAYVGTTPVHEDTVHMSQWYAAKIGPVIREELESLSLLAG